MFAVLTQFHVWVIFSYSNLLDMTNSIIEISEVGVQLSEWQVTQQLYGLIVYRRGEMAAHATFSPNIG